MLTLDDAMTETLERFEEKIAAVHPSHRPANSEVRPHITLGAYEDLDRSACELLLANMAMSETFPAIRFVGIGTFPGESIVMFASPVVTMDLLEVHERFHAAFFDVVTQPMHYYLPGNWVPHCTLAERIPATLLSDVITIANTLPVPLGGQFGTLQIAEFPSARVVYSTRIPS